MRIAIKNDLFEISERVKKIDERYVIYFDTDRQKFIVTVGAYLAAVLPYEELDERAIRYLYHTRAENAENVVKEIDESNEKLQQDGVKRAQDLFEDEFSHRMRLAERSVVQGSLPTL